MRQACLFLLLLLTCVAVGQQSVLPGKKLDKPPVIDGVIGEEEWRDVPSLSGGYDMQTGAADAPQTQYWLAYDKQFIYLAARIADDPKQVRAVEYRQNVSINGDDYVVFAVDPFSTLSDTNQFEINPAGATNIRIAGGRAAKTEWLGEFQAKARLTATGYEIEARIPWAIMRLPSPGTRDLRVTFGHLVVRTGRAYFTDNLANNQANLGIWKQVDVPKPVVRRTVKLLPYVYAGGDRDGAIANAGLDFKAPITQELDLVGSINPDFRNIERQVLSLDFSYFERLAAESRPFFLEGADYFHTSQDAPLFVSQRIPGFDVGAKVYGKLTENSTLAILDTIDFRHQNDFAGAFNYSFDQNNHATVAVTDLESPDVSNKGTFLSYNATRGPWSFFAQHMTTQDTDDGNGHRYNGGFVYQQGGMTGLLEYVEISPKFLPRLGFAPERDLKGFNQSFMFDRPTHWGPVAETSVGFGLTDLRTFENTKYRRNANVNGLVAFKNSVQVDWSANYQEFGGFVDRYVSATAGYPRNSPYRQISFNYVGGRIAGHSYRSIAPAISYRPLRNLQFRASYQQVDHYTHEEQTILSANYDLTRYDSISGRMVRQNADTNFYLAYRRTGKRGNEYYLIIGDPNAPTFRSSIILKAVFPMEFRF